MLNNQEIKIPVLIEDLGMLYATELSKERKRFGIYECQYCSSYFKAQFAHIKSGVTISCKCYRKQAIKKACTKHNIYGHKLYVMWSNIVQRTTNEKNSRFKYYMGRGIELCKEWRHDPMSFYHWAMENGYKEGLSIDRINNDSNYEPSNCRFVTQTTQTRNTQILCTTNKSNYRGVSWHKGVQKWVTQISVSYKKIHLGYFEHAIDAAKAYDTYVIKNNLEHTINGC